MKSHRCSEDHPHDPHFYVVAHCGIPGPTPTENFVCPGITRPAAKERP